MDKCFEDEEFRGDDGISNMEDAPMLATECKNKVINENCGLIPRHYKPFEQIHEENDVKLFKCNYCSQVILF